MSMALPGMFDAGQGGVLKTRPCPMEVTVGRNRDAAPRWSQRNASAAMLVTVRPLMLVGMITAPLPGVNQ
jgi:hypothetical protein